MTAIQREFDRLAATYETLGTALVLQSPAPEEDIDSIQQITGVSIDESLKELWRLTDGSGRQHWFVHDEPTLTLYLFMPIRDVINTWRLFSPYDTAHNKRWYDDERYGERDSRIQRHFLWHSKWITFAAFDGGRRALHYDADPTQEGCRGQITNYLDAPERVVWVARSFLAFFEQSNDRLAQAIEVNAERVKEVLQSSA